MTDTNFWLLLLFIQQSLAIGTQSDINNDIKSLNVCCRETFRFEQFISKCYFVIGSSGSANHSDESRSKCDKSV